MQLPVYNLSLTFTCPVEAVEVTMPSSAITEHTDICWEDLTHDCDDGEFGGELYARVRCTACTRWHAIDEIGISL